MAELPPLTPKAASASTTLSVDKSSGGIMTGGVVLSETQLGNMALKAKQERSKAEADKQLLANRIARLKAEAERAESRIKETQRRAKEILDLKHRNSSNAEARANAAAWLESEHEAQRELLHQNRSQRKQAIDNSRTTMYSLRKTEVSVLKQMRHENEAAVSSMRELEHQRAVARKNIVRESHKQAAERKKMEEDAAREKLRVNRESKRQELDGDTMTHLNAYNNLAAEEQRLIESLQKWQTVQDSAFTQLDSVLGTTGASSGSRPSSRQTFTTTANPNALETTTPRTEE